MPLGFEGATTGARARWASAASAAIHLVLVALLAWLLRPALFDSGTSSPPLITLVPVEKRPETTSTQFRSDGPAPSPATPAGAVAPGRPRLVPNPAPAGPPLRGVFGAVLPGPAGVAVGGSGTEVGYLGASYQSGVLWIPPLPLSADEIAERLGLDFEGKLDSAVNAIIQAHLDSIAADSSLQPMPLPSWVAEVAGLDFGIDPTWIHFAGLKIPTALLALLPWSGSGNYLESRRQQQLFEMRRDIYYSAWRAETMEQFKENVRKLRERKERERQLRLNQREQPGLIEAAPDSSGDGPGKRSQP